MAFSRPVLLNKVKKEAAGGYGESLGLPQGDYLINPVDKSYGQRVKDAKNIGKTLGLTEGSLDGRTGMKNLLNSNSMPGLLPAHETNYRWNNNVPFHSMKKGKGIDYLSKKKHDKKQLNTTALDSPTLDAKAITPDYTGATEFITEESITDKVNAARARNRVMIDNTKKTPTVDSGKGVLTPPKMLEHKTPLPTVDQILQERIDQGRGVDGVRLDKPVLQDAVKKTEKVAPATAKEVAEKVAPATAKEVAEKVAPATAKEVAEKVAPATAKEVVEKGNPAIKLLKGSKFRNLYKSHPYLSLGLATGSGVIAGGLLSGGRKEKTAADISLATKDISIIDDCMKEDVDYDRIVKSAGFFGVLSGKQARTSKQFADNVATGGAALLKRQRNDYAVKMTKNDMKRRMPLLKRYTPFARKQPLNRHMMLNYADEYYATPQYEALYNRVNNADSLAKNEAFKRDALRLGLIGGTGFGGYKGYKMLNEQDPYSGYPVGGQGYGQV